MITLVTDKESIIWASGHFLTHHLPEEYDRWAEYEIEFENLEENQRGKKLDKYLVENAGQPVQYEMGQSKADVIWDCITDLASDFKLTVNNKLLEN